MSYTPESDLNHNFISPDHRYDCHNKADTKHSLSMMQDGWTTDGRKHMVPHMTQWMDIGCGHSYRETDPSCRGCKWRDA